MMQCSLKTPQLFGYPNIHMYHTKRIQFLHITLASDMNDKSYPSSMESNCGSAAATAAATRASQLRRILAAVAAVAATAAAALLFTCVPTSTSLLYWHPLLILVPRESNNQAGAGKQRKLTHQKRQRVYISSPKSLRSTFTSSQPAIKQSRTTTNRRDPLWFPFRPKS